MKKYVNGKGQRTLLEWKAGKVGGMCHKPISNNMHSVLHKAKHTVPLLTLSYSIVF